jgi:hypothetical protein
MDQRNHFTETGNFTAPDTLSAIFRIIDTAREAERYTALALCKASAGVHMVTYSNMRREVFLERGRGKTLQKLLMGAAWLGIISTQRWAELAGITEQLSGAPRCMEWAA